MTSRPVGQEEHCYLVVKLDCVEVRFFQRVQKIFVDFLINNFSRPYPAFSHIFSGIAKSYANDNGKKRR